LGTPDDAVFDDCVPLNKAALDKRFALYCQTHGLDQTKAQFVASGSIGGVYKVPHGDRWLAIKVRYPGIADLCARDFTALQSLQRSREFLTQGAVNC
jgi:predicted unusual protein kinase regulating ubiquinone biosynthesis (AarF/ABC1/UbiB family)